MTKKLKYQLDKNGEPNNAFIVDLDFDEVRDFYMGEADEIIFDLLIGNLNIKKFRKRMIDKMNIYDQEQEQYKLLYPEENDD